MDRVTALLLLGREEGWAEAARLPEDAPTAGERQQVTRGHFNTGEEAMRWGRYAEASQRLERAIELAERHQYLRFLRGALVAQAHLHWFTGAWDDLAGPVADLAADDGMQPVTRAEAVLVSGLLRAVTGGRAQAAECFQHALEVTQRCRALEYSMEPAAALARLWLADGQAADALRVTDEPVSVVAGKGAWLWATEIAPVRVSALAAAGRGGDARALVAAFTRGVRGRNAPATQAALAVCRAVLAEAAGEHARAATLFARAATAWQELPRPYDALLAREGQARCLLATGNPDTGLAVLSEVFHGLSGLGARGDAVRVMDGLRQHGVEVKRPWWGGRRSYGDQLSPRELDVARLLATGRTSRQIAGDLFLSPKTVDRHLGSVMRKLGVSSRTALAVRVAEAGLDPDSPQTAAR